jgi:hypothetical protein
MCGQHFDRWDGRNEGETKATLDRGLVTVVSAAWEFKLVKGGAIADALRSALLVLIVTP